MSAMSDQPVTGSDSLEAEVIVPDVVTSPEAAEAAAADSDIESPGKIIRIGAMVKHLLEEVRNTPVDEASREQLARLYGRSIEELKTALSGELGDELDALSFDFDDDEPPTESEIRLAQAQLVGWLEGLFHGIQATLVAQQMAARAQLEGVRGELGEPAAPGHGPGYI